MARPATFARLVVASIITAFPYAAAGSDNVSDARCHGTHSVWFPLPDECLGVIDTDRPHQTDTPHVVPAGHVQVESALAEVQLGGPLGAPSGARAAHVVILDDEYTLGLVSNVGLQFLFTHGAYDLGAGKLLPPGPLDVRAKFNIVHEDGWVPDVSLVPWVFLPVAPSETLPRRPHRPRPANRPRTGALPRAAPPTAAQTRHMPFPQTSPPPTPCLGMRPARAP